MRHSALASDCDSDGLARLGSLWDDFMLEETDWSVAVLSARPPLFRA